MPKFTENAKNHRKCPTSPKVPIITKKSKKQLKMIKITENGKNHEKCQKSAKMPKI